MVGDYHQMQFMRTKKVGWLPIYDVPKEQRLESLDKFQYIASIVGDDYIRGELTDMVNEMKEWKLEEIHNDYEED